MTTNPLLIIAVGVGAFLFLTGVKAGEKGTTGGGGGVELPPIFAGLTGGAPITADGTAVTADAIAEPAIAPDVPGLTFTGMRGDRPVYVPTKKDAVIQASDLPDKYWLDTRGTRATIVSSFLETETKKTGGQTYGYQSGQGGGYGGITATETSAGASGYRSGGGGTWTSAGYTTRY